MEWIEVEDQLPINANDVNRYETKMVIAADRCGDVYPIEYKAGNSGSTPWGSFDDAAPGFITHWMPLPEHPDKIKKI